MNIDWKRFDLVLIGRIAGLVIIAGGVLLTLWQVADFEDPFGTDDRVRYFLLSALSYLGTGGLLILAAEIADRLTRTWDEDEALAEEEPAPEDAGLPEATEAS